MGNNNSNIIQAFWVAFGSVISYSFILLTSMILSRYFDKGDYGTYRQVMYVYNTFLVVFTLGLPRAYSYFLPRVPTGEAKDTISKITYLFIGLGIIFSLLLFFGSPLIAVFLKNPDLKYAIKLFSLVPVFMLPTMGVDGILASFKKSQYIAIYKGISSFFQLLCTTIPVIFFNGRYESAIVGFTISSMLICIVALYLKNMPVRKEEKRKSSVEYKDIFNFSLPLLYASLWAILMNSADQFFISNYFGKEIFAEFSNGWIDLPFVNMIVGATSIVLLPVFSKIIKENMFAQQEIRPIWLGTMEKTAKMIYPLLLYCMVFSETIMVVLYGEAYYNSGIYFRIKLFLNLFNLIAFAPLLLALGATKYYANVIAIWAVITIVLEYAFINIFSNPYVIPVISVVCHLGVIFSLLHYIARYLKTPLMGLLPLKLMTTITLSGIPTLLVLYYVFVTVLELDHLLILSITLILYLFIFLVIARKVNIDYKSILNPLLKIRRKP